MKDEVLKASLGNFLNTKLEQTHTNVFTLQHKINLLFFTLNGKHKPKSSSDFKDKFFLCIESDNVNS